MKLLLILFLIVSCKNEIITEDTKLTEYINIEATIETIDTYDYVFQCVNPVIKKEPQIGSVFSVTNKIKYSPDNAGSDSFAYSCDETLFSFIIQITEFSAPISENISIELNEDSFSDFTISFESRVATEFSIKSNVVNGTIIGEFPNLKYVPNNNFTGNDSFIFILDNGKKSEFTVSFNVKAVNDPPSSQDLIVTTNEDTAVSFTLLGIDIDSNVTVTKTTAANGTLSCLGQDCTYNPNPNFNGFDYFSYTVMDGEYNSTSNVTINVITINDIPIAENIILNISEDSSVTFNLPTSDDDVLTHTILSYPLGSLSCVDKACSYDALPDYSGTQIFTYQATDGTNTVSGTVTLNIAPVNDPPSGSDQSYVMDMNTTLNIVLFGEDKEGDSLVYTSNTTNNGLLTCSNNICTYLPNLDFYGTDSFTYYVNDGLMDSTSYTISIEVQHVNRKPVANNISIILQEDDPTYAISLDGSDSDGDNLSVEILTYPSQSLTCVLKNCDYLLSKDYNGLDTFTYRLFDGVAYSDPATISITTTPINDAPVSSDQSMIVDYNADVSQDILSSDVDSEITYEIVSSPTNGTVIIEGSSFKYSHTSNVLFDNFTYRSFDGELYSSIRNVSVIINPSLSLRDNQIKLTINSAYQKSVSEFPFYFNLGNLSNTFWSNVQSNGGDILVTDKNNNRLPLEIVNFNSVDKSGAIWFKGNSSSLEFFINYNNQSTPSIDQVSKNDIFGTYNVWSEYIGVWHMDDSDSQLTDSLDVLHLSKDGNPKFNKSSYLKLRKSIEFNTSITDDNYDVFYTDHNSKLEISKFTMESWVFPTSTRTDLRIIQKRDGINQTDYGMYLDDRKAKMRINSGTQFNTDNQVPLNQWSNVVGTYDSTNAKMYINGVLSKQLSVSAPLVNSLDLLEIGGIQGRSIRGFKGNLEEIRLSKKAHSADWIKFNYDMISNHDFWKVGTETIVSSSDFSTPDSNSLPSNWFEVESNSSHLSIKDNQLHITSSDESLRPLSYTSFPEVNTGVLEINFRFKGNRIGNEYVYEFVMQPFDSSASGDLYTQGVAANVKWGSANLGMISNTGFGYQSKGTTYQMFSVNNTYIDVKITLDMDIKLYKIETTLGNSTWIEFEDNTLSKVNGFRFFAHKISGNVELSIDDFSTKAISY